MSCSVEGCKNSRRFKPVGITFHRFPKGELLKEWLKILGKSDDWQWSVNKHVCSEHFKESCFLKRGTRMFLKSNAVPYLVPHTEDQTETITIVRSDEEPSESSQSLNYDTVVQSVNSFEPYSASERESSDSETSENSDDDDKIRQRVEFIRAIHNYCLSPSKIIEKYLESKKAAERSRKQLCFVEKKIRHLKRKVAILKTIIQDLKDATES